MEPGSLGHLAHLRRVANTPLLILRAEAAVEGLVARRRVGAIHLEGTIDEQPPPSREDPRSSREQTLRAGGRGGGVGVGGGEGGWVDRVGVG